MALSVTSAPWQQVAEPALDLRRQLGAGRTEGVVGATDMVVAQRAAGANMSVDVAAGEALVSGDSITNQGLYYVYNDAALNVTGFAAANATNPRIDRVVLRVQDAFHGDAANTATIEIVTGTATAGATLANLNGVAAVGNGRLLLANVLVPTSATTITTANIDTTGEFSEAVLVHPLSQLRGGTSQLRDRILTVAAANFDFQNLPQTYTGLRIEYYLRSTNASTTVDATMRINNAAVSYYFAYGTQTDAASSLVTTGGVNLTQATVGIAPGSTATANHFSAGWVEIPHYSSAGATSFTWSSFCLFGGLSGNMIYRSGGGVYAVTGACTRIALLPGAGNWDVGSHVTVLGLP